MYPQGARNVRCVRCGYVSAVPLRAPSATQQSQQQASTSGGQQAAQNLAQLTCTNPRCRTTLMYPRGAAQVHCSVCGTLSSAAQANTMGHVVCAGCQVALTYTYGARCVKCAVCNHVTPVDGPPSAAGGEQVRTQAVIVENPSSLDEDGNEIPNMVLGVTTVPVPARS